MPGWPFLLWPPPLPRLLPHVTPSTIVRPEVFIKRKSDTITPLLRNLVGSSPTPGKFPTWCGTSLHPFHPLAHSAPPPLHPFLPQYLQSHFCLRTLTLVVPSAFVQWGPLSLGLNVTSSEKSTLITDLNSPPSSPSPSQSRFLFILTLNTA